ncbi:hypothetical protein [Maribacter sp. R86514]|uniref:hypothetical protein n=1 Tax=Maribacter sp. R86514 TaxID=3093854 RepID=UPI0037C9D34D
MKIKGQLLFFTILCFSLLFSKIYSQEFSNTLELDIPEHSLTENISLIDKSGHIHHVYKVYDHIRHLEFDEKFTLINDSEYDDLSMSQQKIIGYQTTDKGEIRLFVSANNNRKFSILTLFDNTLSSTEIDLKLKKEKLIKIINYNNNFYLLTVGRGSSTIHVYEFDGKKVSKKDYPFNTEIFLNWDNYALPLSSVITKQNIEFIEPNIPLPIEQTSSPIKIYLNGDKLILTLNHRREETKILMLNLTDSSSKVKTILMPNLKLIEGSASRANSFLFYNKLFQVSTAPKGMSFEITDIETLEINSQYSFNEDEPIPFKNSPIYQEYNLLTNGKTKEIEKTKTFLRKISNTDLGIAVYQTNDILNISIGGTKELNANTDGIATAGILFGAIGAAIYASISSTSRTYDIYANSKSVYIKSLFSADSLKNINGDTSKNPFDKIQDYIQKHELKRTNFGCIIKNENSFIFSYFDEKDHELTLVKFEF